MGLDALIALGLGSLFVSAVAVFFVAPETREWESPASRPSPEPPEA